MKTKRILIQLSLLAVLLLANSINAQTTTAFTYQGRLNTAAGAANGSYDLTFSLYDANVAGNFIAGPITNSAVAVSNGLFTVTLDFGGGVFTGTNYWAQIGVRATGGGSFAALVPRQQITPAPYALALVSPQATGFNPAGSVIAFAGTNVPTGYLPCDGSAVSRTVYANLFAAIGTAWGAGNGSTTFNLPDLRGQFLRGVNGTRNDNYSDPGDARGNAYAGGNSGNAVGSYQTDQFKNHTHAPKAGNGFMTWANGYGSGDDSQATLVLPNGGALCGLDYTVSSTGGTETRPKNAYVNYVIKY